MSKQYAIKVNDNEVFFTLHYGLQYFIKNYLRKEFRFNQYFFEATRDDAIMRLFPISTDPDYINQLSNLHDLGYLPIEIRTVPEGTIVQPNIITVIVKATVEGYDWLAEEISSKLNLVLSQASITATQYLIKKSVLDITAQLSNSNNELCKTQIYNILDDSKCPDLNNSAKLLSFAGSDMFRRDDTRKILTFIRDYYVENKDLYKDNRNHIRTFNLTKDSSTVRERQIKFLGDEVYKYDTFIITIKNISEVLWPFVENILPELVPYITKRPGKFVIRLDTFENLERTICGYDENEPIPKNISEAQAKGLARCLYDMFPGEDSGTLDSHIEVHCGGHKNFSTREMGSLLFATIQKGFHSTFLSFTSDESYDKCVDEDLLNPFTIEKIESSDDIKMILKKRTGQLIGYQSNNESYFGDDLGDDLDNCEYKDYLTIYKDGDLLYITNFNGIKANIDNQLKIEKVSDRLKYISFMYFMQSM